MLTVTVPTLALYIVSLKNKCDKMCEANEYYASSSFDISKVQDAYFSEVQTYITLATVFSQSCKL